MAGTTERNQASGYERCFVDRRLVAFFEPPREPAGGDPGAVERASPGPAARRGYPSSGGATLAQPTLLTDPA
jgi:hypothetical protein